MPWMAVRIDQVQRVLGEILQWQAPADAILSKWMRAHPKMGMRDRSQVAGAVFDVLRHLRRYRQFAESGVGPAARRLAILGLAATQEASVLREVLTVPQQEWLDGVRRIDLAALPRAVRLSLPDWLDAALAAQPDGEALAQSLNQPAALDLRVNPLKLQRDDLLKQLLKGPAAQYSPRATVYSPWGVRLDGRPAVNRWPQFEAGEIEVQDEGSQLLAALVGPKRGEMVIDFCAGAGGKTLMLGALMRSSGRLYAFDVSATRLARAKPRFARSGLSNITTVAIENENDARVKRLAGKAHRVLVDAPCSGIGTLRRNPDLKWRQHPQSVAELVALQTRILASAARCVKAGGRLVYATCSVLPEENEGQIDQFLQSHADFQLLDAPALLHARDIAMDMTGPYLRLRPDLHGTDGFFAAVLERRSAPADAASKEDGAAASLSDAEHDALDLSVPDDADTAADMDASDENNRDVTAHPSV